MFARQLDLFAGAGNPSDHTAASMVGRPRNLAQELDDDALIAAIPLASLGDCRSLAAEAGRRRLVGAIAALEALCRRFQGFGIEHAIPEQTAALGALTVIGGSEAACAARRIIVDRIVQGTGLNDALEAAAELGVGLPGSVVVSLLRHPRSAPAAAAVHVCRRRPFLRWPSCSATRIVSSPWKRPVRSAGWAGASRDPPCCGYCRTRPLLP